MIFIYYSSEAFLTPRVNSLENSEFSGISLEFRFILLPKFKAKFTFAELNYIYLEGKNEFVGLFHSESPVVEFFI
jgi:hypothetical protein